MQIGVLTETASYERRVALTPDSVGRLIAAGHSVYVQSGAGERSNEDDDAYRAAGAVIAKTPEEILATVDLLTAVGQLDQQTASRLNPGTAVIGLSSPKDGRGPAGVFMDRHATFFALELLPRITRAQSMDALSSQAMVAGYRAALIAAERLPRFFPLLMTAAGTVPPAKVLVLGAGVAGLQAIATAKRLGAVVEAYDVRDAAAEEIRRVLRLGGRLLVADWGRPQDPLMRAMFLNVQLLDGTVAPAEPEVRNRERLVDRGVERDRDDHGRALPRNRLNTSPLNRSAARSATPM